MSDLQVTWSKKDKDLLVKYPNSCDGGLIIGHLTSKVHSPGMLEPFGKWYPSLVEELESRGYDITSLKFSIDLKSSEKEKI